MDLMASLRALGRQRILTCFLLLLTLLGGVAAWVKLPGPYTTESMVTLIPSKQAAKVNGNNPYLSYGGSENVAGDIVLREVMDPGTTVALAKRGYTASYTVADDLNTSAPRSHGEARGEQEGTGRRARGGPRPGAHLRPPADPGRGALPAARWPCLRQPVGRLE